MYLIGDVGKIVFKVSFLPFFLVVARLAVVAAADEWAAAMLASSSMFFINFFSFLPWLH